MQRQYDRIMKTYQFLVEYKNNHFQPEPMDNTCRFTDHLGKAYDAKVTEVIAWGSDGPILEVEYKDDTGTNQKLRGAVPTTSRLTNCYTDLNPPINPPGTESPQPVEETTHDTEDTTMTDDMPVEDGPEPDDF